MKLKDGSWVTIWTPDNLRNVQRGERFATGSKLWPHTNFISKSQYFPKEPIYTEPNTPPVQLGDEKTYFIYVRCHPDGFSDIWLPSANGLKLPILWSEQRIAID